MSNSVGREIFSWIKTIALALLLAWLVNSFVVVNATVPTGSMENTIMPKDRILALRLSYIADNPARGDVIIFRYPDDPTGETLYVKRVIGLPGEMVTVRDGKVFINNSDEGLLEDYTKEDAIGEFGPYTVPADSYFVMGDNRNNSLDSRYWQNTYVPKEEILGKVLFRYYKGFKMID